MTDESSANIQTQKEDVYDDVVRESALARWAYRLSLIPVLGVPCYLLLALLAFLRMGVVGQTGFHYLGGGMRRILMLNLLALGAAATWWFLPQEISVYDGGIYMGGGPIARDWSFKLEKKKHGPWIQYNPEFNPNIYTWNWRICHYNHGVLNGEYTEFFSAAKKCAAGRYINGQKDGLWSFWHMNGQKKEEGPYVKNLPNGDWIFWNEAGGKRLQGKLVNGNKEGQWTEWLENGQILSIGEFREGKQTGKWSFFRPNGQVMWEGDYVNGQPHGKFITYFSNGLIEKEGECYRGKYTGLFTVYYNNGTMRATGYMETGYYRETRWHGRSGKWTFWYPSGIIAAEGKFKTINPGEKPREDFDHKIGLWRYWDQNGFQLRDKTYDDYGKVSVESAEKGEGIFKIVKVDPRRYTADNFFKRKTRTADPNTSEQDEPPEQDLKPEPATSDDEDEPIIATEDSNPEEQTPESEQTEESEENEEDNPTDPKDNTTAAKQDTDTSKVRLSEFDYKIGAWKEIGPVGIFHGSYVKSDYEDKSSLPSGLWTEYYPDNKQKAAEGHILKYRYGQWTFWYENGRKKAEGEYNRSSDYGAQVTADFSDETENTIRYRYFDRESALLRDGNWTYWNSDGQKTLEEIFEMGTLQSRTTYYYDKGKLVKSIKQVIDVTANAPHRVEHRDGDNRVIFSKEFKN